MWKKLTEFCYYQSGKPCWWLCRIGGENGERLPLMISANIVCGPDGKTYQKEDVEWLDELEYPESNKQLIKDLATAHFFTLEDMKSALQQGKESLESNLHTYSTYDSVEIDKENSAWFKDKYNIEL